MNDDSFLILFLAIIAIMALVPFFLKRFSIPSVISLLVVGMFMGPTGIGYDVISALARFLEFIGTTNNAQATCDMFNIFVDKLGSLGLMFLMALAGMEADFNMKNCRFPVCMLSVLTFFVPALGGYLLYNHYFPDALPGKLLFASLFASHSVGIVFPVMRELKLSKTRFGSSVLIATVITDILSILLLAVSVQLFKRTTGTLEDSNVGISLIERHATLFGAHFNLIFVLIVLLYLAITVFTIFAIAKWLQKRLKPSEDLMVTLILLIILVASLVGEIFGINFIVGSFIAGLGLSKVVRQQDMLLFKRFESIGYGFLIPFLFVSIGMKTNFRVFLRPGSFPIVLFTILTLVGTKLCSGYIAMRASRFSHREGLAAGLMTIPQLSATLTAAAIGKGLGMLDEQFFNAIIILSIVTTLPVPMLVRKVLFKNGEPIISATSQEHDVPVVVEDPDLL